MLNKLYINGFKAIDNITINLSNLTLLVGTNSSGKSTIIQSILLLVNNITEKNYSTLNGNLVSIGDFRDARNFIINAKEFLRSCLSKN